MAVLMIFEMTLSYQLMLPLSLVCVIAYFVAQASGEASMHEITIRRNREQNSRIRLRATRMRNKTAARLSIAWNEYP